MIADVIDTFTATAVNQDFVPKVKLRQVLVRGSHSKNLHVFRVFSGYAILLPIA